ncbi:Lipase, class 3 family-containing protein [Strongyloides ratti]|uniref:Lipase, class 3 family-containing protein n=1 Tax=Strongyloides ratti TaxID=34506 RepID=A0A090LP19_STRRB|nr:Lipase, class 3 family-containing protein [Strongyloides ratti]CEF69934.1 Lipase, class 3 family-containing protein [Strongyloides ratti]
MKFCILFLVYLITPFTLATYSDGLARKVMLSMSSAAYSDIPERCIKNVFGQSGVFGRQVSVTCDKVSNDRCSGFTAVSHDDKAIIISFRGSTGFLQLAQEASGEIFNKPIPFFSGGAVSLYFYNAFNDVWTKGLKDSFLGLKNKYPTYKVYVTGHSLGGAMACICAATIVKSGYISSNNILLYTMGEPRVGDDDFVKGFDKLNIEAYRIIHKHDLVPHLPPDHLFGYKHHKEEIFYNNDMTSGSKFKICSGDDSNSCSSASVDLSINDHLHYFNTDVSDYGYHGCFA